MSTKITIRVPDGDGKEHYVGEGAYVRDETRLWRISEVARTGSTGPHAVRVWLENAHGFLGPDSRYLFRRVWRSPASLRAEFSFVRAAPPAVVPEVVSAADLERLAA